MNRLLLIEDDKAMVVGLSFNLRDEGYEVTHCADGESGLQTALNGNFDLIVLDMMLPGISGMDVLRQLRARDLRTPVLILSALSANENVVAGLNAGADDYLPKPFELAVLLARVRSLIRSRAWLAGEHLTKNDDVLIIGTLRADFKHLLLHGTNGEVALSYKEGMLLRKLAEHEGEVVTRDDLLREVWGYTDGVQTRTLDQFILALRKKIEPDHRHPRHLLTAPGQGYRFVRD